MTVANSSLLIIGVKRESKMELLGKVFEVEWKLDEDEVKREERSFSSSSSNTGELSPSEDYTSSAVPLDAVREKPPHHMKQGSYSPEVVEMLKETFSKLLLGEDLSGGEKGVSAALAVSNAITDLSAATFGKVCRLEPLPSEKKLAWKRGMEWLLSVSDYIVELTPSLHTLPDGTKREVMTSRPRQDLYVSLPALLKLDNMIIEVLDGLEDTEFWYVDQEGVLATQSPPPKEKWWLPVPRVPTCGLSGKARKQLQQIRTSTNQILKAAMAINCCTLAEMEVPESYLETLSKNGYTGLEELINGYNFSGQFSPEPLLDCLNLTSQRRALEIADQLEATIHIWGQKSNSKNSKLSWEMVKEFVVDADKREVFTYRAESLLTCLRQRFPGLSQTTLHMSKIQHNKDLGKSILESYSRAMQSLAFNIVARINDLLHVDDLTKTQKSPRKSLTEYLATDSKGDHNSDDLEGPDSCSTVYKELIVTADDLDTLYSCI